MKDETFTTTQVCIRSGTPWYSVTKYASKGLLPTAILIPRGKKGRWQYTEKDIKFLTTLKFFRSQGFEFWVSYDKTKEQLETDEMKEIVVNRGTKDLDILNRRK